MVRCSIPWLRVLPFLFLLCANGHSRYTASSIDAVILTILKNEVSTPPSERHAIFSDELRRKIEPLLATDETYSEEEIRLLSDIEGNLARERFLFHLSMRSAVLFSSLDPFALNWSERTIDLGQDLKNFRIIRDAGWTEEFTQEMNVAPCFDVLSVAKMVWKKGRNKNGEHEKRVKELAKVETQLPLDFVVVAQEKERGPMTIIDGNHRVSTLLGKNKGLNIVILYSNYLGYQNFKLRP